MTSSFAEVRALWQREWLASSRLARTPWLASLAGFSLGTGMLLFAVGSSEPSSDLGRKLFHVCFAVNVLFATLIGPAIAANTIALEREGKTWEALVMAGISPRSIDSGKFLGAYTHLVAYLLGLLPCAGIPHVFGGVSCGETLLATLMVFAVGALAVRFGLFMSAVVPSARAALLATVFSSAGLCFVVMLIAVGATKVLGNDIGMQSLRSEGPVFWPVALVNEPFSFDYARYLVVLPIGAFAVAWFCLRDLTRHALSTNTVSTVSVRSESMRLATYLVSIVVVAVLAGLVPNRSDEIILGEVLFSLVVFGAIVALSGDAPARTTSTFRSLVLIAGGAGGTFLVAVVAHVMLEALGRSAHPEYGIRSDDVLTNMLVYAPAFTAFVTGLAAVLRTLVRRPAVARLATIGVTGAIAIVPLIAGVLARPGGSSPPSVIAASPIGAIFMNASDRPLVVIAAVVWMIAGLALIIVTHRREQ
jgi:hypothetical protein